jgi:hypothetical protein
VLMRSLRRFCRHERVSRCEDDTTGASYTCFQGKHRRKDLRRLMNNFRKDKGSKSMGCTQSGLVKGVSGIDFRGMADHGEQAGRFSGE